VCPEHETLSYYFSSLGGTITDFKKPCWEPLCRTSILYPVGSAGLIERFGASGACNIDALFFMLSLDRYGYHEKRAGIHYTKLMFLHPVQSVDHVVQSQVSRA
jgi:hypothetical protein